MLIIPFGKIMLLAFLAVIVALIEIHSEGEKGWAEAMPTWYRTTGLSASIYSKIMSGKPLTGYHTFMFFFPILLFHLHFVMGGVPWSLAGELNSWALYFAWCPLWDYYWFVLNPAYEGKFAKQHIWWHAKSRWVFNLFPIDYLFGVVISLLFALSASLLAHDEFVSFFSHCYLLCGWLVMTVLLYYVIAPHYKRWHKHNMATCEKEKFFQELRKDETY